jgi:hypothetical protein
MQSPSAQPAGSWRYIGTVFLDNIPFLAFLAFFAGKLLLALPVE